MNAEPGGDTLFGIRPSPAFGSGSRSRRRNGTGWGRNGWTVQGRLNRSPPSQRRARLHGQARCWFDSRHEPPGWRQALPCADRNTACRARRRSRYRENYPALVSATVSAIPGLPLPAVDPCTPPATSTEPRPGHPLHPMIAGHSTGPETASRVQRSPLPSNWLFEVSRRDSERRSLALVPAAPKGPGLILSVARQVLAEAARAGWAISTLVGRLMIDTRVSRGSGFNLRDVFPTGCVAGRAEGAARSPGRGLRRGAELDSSRAQPVVDGVERFDQLVVPWILRIE